jgi:putative membrane protein
MYGCDIGSIMGWGNGLTHMFFWLIAISLAVIFLARYLPQNKRSADSFDSLEILKKRLASGEITLDEYEKLKKVI